MKNGFRQNSQYLLLLLLVLMGAVQALAQLNTSTPGNNYTNPNGTVKDTTHAKSNTSKWKDEEANVYYEHLGSQKAVRPDTSLHTFQQRPFQQGWSRDMGNPGSPVHNMMFTPDNHVGPSLGYHVFDPYRFQLDSVAFYNTNRPYTIFNYQLGSKLEQVAGFLHSQNIKPNWNFMIAYRKTNAPGFYKIQRNNHDNVCFTTNYKSLDRHYQLYGALVYNKEQHDENGGIVNDSELNSANYTDRKTVDATYQNNQYSITRSPVSNMQRDFGLLLYHTYVFGPIDTTYNADSTAYTYKLKPRFSIGHKLTLSSEKHLYKDLNPDSLRYVDLFTASFKNSGPNYYIAGGDSVYTQQRWFWIDNRLTINGFLGKVEDPLRFELGAGNRYDEFISDGLAGGVPDRTKSISNYVEGQVVKEALKPGQWQYGAQAMLFATGDYAGNLNLDATIGKSLKNSQLNFLAGVKQSIGTAPYSFTHYENQYANLHNSFNKESISDAYLMLDWNRVKLSGGVNNYVLGNYLYLDAASQYQQYSIPINVTQAWVRKVFRLGRIYLDNQLAYQQAPDNTPLNIPSLMGRHQLSFENAVFKGALKIATGVEVRYHSSYYAPGYNPTLNQFYHQNSRYVSNNPEFSLFLNFRIKHFRAFIMGDQLQQIFGNNVVLYSGPVVKNFFTGGDQYTPVYATQNAMLRFGFSWVLIN